MISAADFAALIFHGKQNKLNEDDNMKKLGYVLMVLLEAAALANKSMSANWPSVRFSSPVSKIRSRQHPKKASPAPVVSIVLTFKYVGW